MIYLTFEWVGLRWRARRGLAVMGAPVFVAGGALRMSAWSAALSPLRGGGPG